MKLIAVVFVCADLSCSQEKDSFYIISLNQHTLPSLSNKIAN